MKENSREEDINYLDSMVKEYKQFGNLYNEDYEDEERIYQALERILSDYKRVLKENEELRESNEIYSLQGSNIKLEIYIKDNYLSKQKIKDIIDRIDYDIKKTKEIISNNTNIYASYRKNDYQIVRLRAMNTKSLDIKKRLQKLLESEE